MDKINNSDKFSIVLSGFDLKLVLEALENERYERLRKTPWECREDGHYYYDTNAKPVRQVDSIISHIKKQTLK